MQATGPSPCIWGVAVGFFHFAGSASSHPSTHPTGKDQTHNAKASVYGRSGRIFRVISRFEYPNESIAKRGLFDLPFRAQLSSSHPWFYL